MKKILIGLFAVSLITSAYLPRAMAVWWNPSTWFKNEVDQKVINEPPAVIEPVVQEKIITKTITVDNPELQNKVNALNKENDLLKQQIAIQSNLLKQMSAQYNDVAGQYNSMINALPKFEVALKAMIKPIIDQLNYYRAASNLSTLSQPSIPTPTYYPPTKQSWNCTTNWILSTAYTSCY